MGDTKSGTISISGVDFAEMARQVVAVKVAEALAVGSDGAVQQLVLAALTRKVDATNGSDNPRSYASTSTWVEWVAGDMIQRATKEVLAERVAEMRPMLKKLVEAELKRSAKTMAAALVDTYAHEAKSGYRIGVNVAFTKHDRD